MGRSSRCLVAHAPILENYALFLRQSGIEIAGIAFVRDREIHSCDVDTHTNYNAAAEAAAGVPVTGR